MLAQILNFFIFGWKKKRAFELLTINCESFIVRHSFLKATEMSAKCTESFCKYNLTPRGRTFFPCHINSLRNLFLNTTFSNFAAFQGPVILMISFVVKVKKPFDSGERGTPLYTLYGYVRHRRL